MHEDLGHEEWGPENQAYENQGCVDQGGVDEGHGSARNPDSSDLSPREALIRVARRSRSRGLGHPNQGGVDEWHGSPRNLDCRDLILLAPVLVTEILVQQL